MDEHEISGWGAVLADGEVALASGDYERSIELLATVRDVLRVRAEHEELAQLPPAQRDEVVRLALRLLRAWRVAVRQAALRN